MTELMKNSQYPPFSDGTLVGLREQMKLAGIDISVMLNIATSPRQTVKVNDWAIQTNAEKDIISFGSVHPDFADYKSELDRLAAAGIKGIKFHPEYQSFCVIDKKMYPIYERIASHGMVMIFHCGKDLIPRDPLMCTPDMMAKLIEDFKGAKIVGAHLGGQLMWDEVEEHLLGKDIYLDTSFGFKYLSHERVSKFIATHGADKFLFATDAPWQKQTVEIAEMLSFVTDPNERELIFHKNAERLLGL